MAEKHALVVDAQTASLAAISKMLKAEGFAVEQVSNGREALKCLAQRTFHVVAAEHHMGAISGLDLWWLMTKEARHQGTRFLLVTSKEDRDQLMLKHVELPTILCKPFGVAMLHKALLGEPTGDGEDIAEV